MEFNVHHFPNDLTSGLLGQNIGIIKLYMVMLCSAMADFSGWKGWVCQWSLFDSDHSGLSSLPSVDLPTLTGVFKSRLPVMEPPHWQHVCDLAS